LSSPIGSQFVLREDKGIHTFFAPHRYSSCLIVWDTFKCTFRGHSIQYSSLKQKQFRSKEIRLIKEIEEVTVQVDGNGNCTK
jgi:hypothetical protein